MRRPAVATLALILCSLAAGPAAAEGLAGSAGVRLGWHRGSSGVRQVMGGGAVFPELYGELRRKGSPFSVEGSMSGRVHAGHESGVVPYTAGGLTFRTGYVLSQTLFIFPLQATLKVSPAEGRLRPHAGAGAALVTTLLTSSLTFANPTAAAHSLPRIEGRMSPGLHAQAGMDVLMGSRWGLGAVGRWSWARSSLTLRRGLARADPFSAEYSRQRPAGDVGGLSLAGSAWLQF